MPAKFLFPVDLRLACIALSVLFLSGCGQLVSNAKQEFANDLSNTILEYDDPDTIKKALPAYLVLVSSMIRGEPENADLLESGAKLYSAYASAFVEPGESKITLSERAFRYARQSICLRNASACHLQTMAFDDYRKLLQQFDVTQARHLFVLAGAWAGSIEANSGDWNKVAELPRVKAAIQRVIELDENVDNGNAHVYMAVMESLLPPALGGKPDLARQHFERALVLSGGRNLMAKVLYAEKYARLLFDRELHDRLLNEVLAVEIAGEETSADRLANTLARQKAKQLLETADDYF